MLTWPKNVKYRGSDWRFALRLWDGLGANRRPVIIIPSELQNADDPSTGAGECRSASLVSVCCGVIGARNLSILYAHEILGNRESAGAKTTGEQLALLKDELKDADVILLGSGLNNVVTKIAMELVAAREPNLKIDCSKSSDGNHELIFEGRRYRTRYVEDKPRTPESMITDYGVFLIRPNLFSDDPMPQGRLFIFSGAHTYGTQAAAEAIFSPQGAAEIGRRFRKEKGIKQDQWRRCLTALIEVSPIEKVNVEGEITDGLALCLTQRDRRIRVVLPELLSGAEIRNPVMSPALDKFYDYVNYGKWRTFGLNFLSLLLMVLVGTGLYYHYWLLCVAAVSFYIVERWIHREDE